MAPMASSSDRDIWTEWLLERRFAGDAAMMERALNQFLYPVRDQVLDNASLQGSETLLDAGCGDGLIAFGALERLPRGRVILTDISTDLLAHVESVARRMGVADRCRFLHAPAEDLSPIPDATVDVVTTRSVLIYVADKARALGEFHRVLRSDGRISLFEPINAYSYPPPRHQFLGFDVTPIMAITDKLKAVYLALQPPESDPMTNFDERDLVALAETAGFDDIRLDLTIEVKPLPAHMTWDHLLNAAGNPKIPSLNEAMAAHLTAAEREALLAHLRPLFDAGAGRRRLAVAYLRAVKK